MSELFAGFRGPAVAGAMLALILGLSACQTGDAPPLDRTPMDPPMPVLRRAQADCLARGGTFAPGGLSGHVCFVATPDAGKSCRRASDCNDTCLADTRQCNAVTPLFGCYSFLDDDGRVLEICVD